MADARLRHVNEEESVRKDRGSSDGPPASVPSATAARKRWDDDGAPWRVRLERLGSLTVIPAILAFFIVNPWVRWPCPVRLVAAEPCPMCGMTRACLLAATGRLHEAWHMHPLVLVVAPLLTLHVIAEAWGFWRTGNFGFSGDRKAVRTVGYVIVGLAVILWIVRFFGLFGGPVHVDRGLFK